MGAPRLTGATLPAATASRDLPPGETAMPSRPFRLLPPSRYLAHEKASVSGGPRVQSDG